MLQSPIFTCSEMSKEAANASAVLGVLLSCYTTAVEQAPSQRNDPEQCFERLEESYILSLTLPLAVN